VPPRYSYSFPQPKRQAARHSQGGSPIPEPELRLAEKMPPPPTRHWEMGLLHGWVTSDLACPWWAAWKDVVVPKPYPRGFRDDVVAVARRREPGVTIEQVAPISGSIR
jgi:hypothetical protein